MPFHLSHPPSLLAQHRKCVAVAPPYLKERVRQEAALPLVMVGGEGKEGRRRKRSRGKEGATGVAGSKKRRRDAGKENMDGKKEEEREGEGSAAASYKAQAVDSTRQVGGVGAKPSLPPFPPSPLLMERILFSLPPSGEQRSSIQLLRPASFPPSLPPCLPPCLPRSARPCWPMRWEGG